MIDHDPDVVVTATGASPTPVVLPDGTRALTLEEALDRPWSVGPAVAVVDHTGEWAAMSVVEHLARLGRTVAVVSPVAAIGWHVTRYSAPALFSRLRRLGVALHPLGDPVAWDGSTLTVESAGARRRIPADTVVGAGYGRSRTDLADALRTRGMDVRRVGDAVAPRTGVEAVFEGHEVARAL